MATKNLVRKLLYAMQVGFMILGICAIAEDSRFHWRLAGSVRHGLHLSDLTGPVTTCCPPAIPSERDGGQMRGWEGCLVPLSWMVEADAEGRVQRVVWRLQGPSGALEPGPAHCTLLALGFLVSVGAFVGAAVRGTGGRSRAVVAMALLGVAALVWDIVLTYLAVRGSHMVG